MEIVGKLNQQLPYPSPLKAVIEGGLSTKFYSPGISDLASADDYNMSNKIHDNTDGFNKNNNNFLNINDLLPAAGTCGLGTGNKAKPSYNVLEHNIKIYGGSVFLFMDYLLSATNLGQFKRFSDKAAPTYLINKISQGQPVSGYIYIYSGWLIINKQPNCYTRK